MIETVLLRDLSVVMVVAAATTWVCHALKQPVVLGYLLAGILIGPNTPPFSLVKDIHSIHTMAELGLVFLMFALARPDILPVGDLGIRKGMQLHFGLRKLPEPRRMEQLAAPWRPFRSVASWYMWRLLEPS